MKDFVFMGYLYNRLKKVIEARILKRWGSTSVKKSIWDEEFESGQWDYLEHTDDDIIYHFLYKYSNNGSILDLGCGTGNTGNEIKISRYDWYTGVDISEIAIQRAENRSKKNNRQQKNEYICEDICLFVPRKHYDIILFRESIFYIPKNNVKGVLERYYFYLKEGGVFIVRMCDRKKFGAIVELIKRSYHVLEISIVDDADIILVFN